MPPPPESAAAPEPVTAPPAQPAATAPGRVAGWNGPTLWHVLIPAGLAVLVAGFAILLRLELLPWSDSEEENQPPKEWLALREKRKAEEERWKRDREWRDGPRDSRDRSTVMVGRLSYSTDGHLLLVEYLHHDCDGMGPRCLSLWDMESEKELWTVRGEDQVAAPRWIPGTRHIVLTDWDRQLSVWDVDRGPPGRDKESILSLGKLSEGDFSRALSADGQRLLTVGEFGCRIWDLAERKILCYLSGANGVVLGAHFSPDGKRVLTSFAAHQGSDVIALWNAEGGFPIKVWGKESQWKGVEGFHPDSKYVFFCRYTGEGLRDYTTSLVDPESEKELWSGRTGEHRARTPDGKAILALDREGLRRVGVASGHSEVLWRGSVIRGEDLGIKQRASAITFSPDRRRIVAARGWCGVRRAGEDIRLELWDGATGRLLRRLAVIIEGD